MEAKRNYIKVLLVVIVLSILFGIGWLLGKNNFSVFNKLPLTGEPGVVVKLDPTKLEKTTPWDLNISRTKPQDAPTIEELTDVYLGLMQSIEDRDTGAFSSYASSKLYWIIMQNAKVIAINEDDMVISQTGDLTGAEYFKQFAPARFRYQIPWEPQYFQPVKMEAITIPADENYILNDKKTGINTFVTDHAYENSYRVYFNIEGYPYINRDMLKPEGSYAEDGLVDFVYENGSWKVFTQSWQVYFLGEYLIDADDIRISANGKLLQLNPSSPKAELTDIQLQVGDIVRWDLISGMVLSTDISDGLKQWNSPLLLGNSYQRSFDEPGVYSYAIINHDDEIHGKITVSE